MTILKEHFDENLAKYNLFLTNRYSSPTLVSRILCKVDCKLSINRTIIFFSIANERDTVY